MVASVAEYIVAVYLVSKLARQFEQTPSISIGSGHGVDLCRQRKKVQKVQKVRKSTRYTLRR